MWVVSWLLPTEGLCWACAGRALSGVFGVTDGTFPVSCRVQIPTVLACNAIASCVLMLFQHALLGLMHLMCQCFAWSVCKPFLHADPNGPISELRDPRIIHSCMYCIVFQVSPPGRFPFCPVDAISECTFLHMQK